jgi:hypothetical protein
VSQKADFLENAVINAALRNTVGPFPIAQSYLALFTAAPGETGGGTEVGAGVGYSRQAVAFDAPSNGATQNSALETFGPCTTTNWGSITHGALVDAASGAANYLYHGALTVARTVNVGDSLEFAIGAIQVAET